jgi:hypothetical protein
VGAAGRGMTLLNEFKKLYADLANKYPPTFTFRGYLQTLETSTTKARCCVHDSPSRYTQSREMFVRSQWKSHPYISCSPTSITSLSLSTKAQPVSQRPSPSMCPYPPSPITEKQAYQKTNANIVVTQGGNSETSKCCWRALSKVLWGPTQI